MTAYGHDDTPADAAVNAALAPLQNLQQLPTPDHVAIYDQLHDRLMAELDADA